MKSKRICLACANAFLPLLHVPRQRYCSSKAFQRAVDATGSATRAVSTATIATTRHGLGRNWRAGHASYWREYLGRTLL